MSRGKELSRSTYNLAVYGIFLRDEKILLQRRGPGKAYMPSRLSLPSGHVEPGETAIDALVREMGEEIDVAVDSKNVIHVHTAHRPGSAGGYLDLFFEIRRWKGTPKNNEIGKSLEIGWYDKIALSEDTVPFVALALKCIYKGFSYSEYPREP